LLDVAAALPVPWTVVAMDTPIVTELVRGLEPTTRDPFIDDLEPRSPAAVAVQAREYERRRLSRDLHDGVGATLAGLIMLVGAAHERTNGTARDALTEIETGLVGVADELRFVIDDLRSPGLRELGLAGALRRHASRIAAGGQLCVSVFEHRPPGAEPLPVAVEVAAYRIAAEALTNVGRHAHAGRCDLTIAHRDDDLLLLVRDDGVGIHEARPDRSGLAGMRERAAEAGGHCTWHAVPSGGTLVECDLPLA
jgi:two-component system NarL family sensor kinase